MTTTKTEYYISCHQIENPNQHPTTISATSYANALEVIRGYVERGKGKSFANPDTFIFTTTDGETAYSVRYEIWEKEIVTTTQSNQIPYNL